MQKKLRRTLLLLLCVLLLSASMTACGTVDMGDAVLTMGDATVGEVELTYWTATLKTAYLRENQGQGSDTPAFWNTVVADGKTHRDCFEAQLWQWLEELVSVKYLCSLYGIQRDADAKDNIRADIAEKKQYYEDAGDLDAWNEHLAALGVTEESLREIYLTEHLRQQLRTYFATDQTLSDLAYADALQEYFLAKYLHIRYAVIYLSHDGSSGADLDETQRAAKEDKIADLLYRGRNGEDAAALTALYTEHDLSGTPNGLFLSIEDAGYGDHGLTRAAMSLADGEWGRLDVTDENGLSYAYVFYREPIALANYTMMSESEKEGLADHEREAYYRERITAFSDRIVRNTEVWERYSVITIPASKNTNI